MKTQRSWQHGSALVGAALVVTILALMGMQTIQATRIPMIPSTHPADVVNIALNRAFVPGGGSVSIYNIPADKFLVLSRVDFRSYIPDSGTSEAPVGLAEGGGSPKAWGYVTITADELEEGQGLVFAPASTIDLVNPSVDDALASGSLIGRLVDI